MSCFSPIQGYQSHGLSANGKHTFTTSRAFARKKDGVFVTMSVRCRKCVGCRYDHSRETSVKLIHESQSYLTDDGFNTAFITLTYNDDFIPAYGSLNYDHFRNFMKRLRLAIAPTRIRYYMIGEYGDLNLRPHYHAIIYGFNFPDRYVLGHRNGNVLYDSKLLQSCWTPPYRKEPYGYTSIGDVSVASCAYVARYCMKKIIGFDKDSLNQTFDPVTGVFTQGRYQRFHRETGAPIFVSPERPFMSNGGGKDSLGGLGKRWFDKYALSDLYSKSDSGVYKDHTHMPNGLVVRPPAYYDKLLSRVNPEMLEEIKKSRQDFLATHSDEFTPEKLEARKAYLLHRLSKLKRSSREIYNVT